MPTQVVDAGEGARVTGTCYDAQTPKQAIPKSAVDTFTVTLTDTASGAIVNSRDNQDVLDTHGGSMDATSGAFAWIASSADTTPLDDETDYAAHEAAFRVVGDFIGSPLEFSTTLLCFRSPLLCSFDDVRMQLASQQGNTLPDEDETFVSLMIAGFTARVEQITARTVRRSTVDNPTVEVFSPVDNTSFVDLSAWPISQIISVKESVNGDFASVDALDPSEYAMATDYTLRLRFRPWLKGTGYVGALGTVQVTYVGGIARTGGAVPMDLRIAAMRQVAYWVQRRTQLGVSGMSVAGGSVTLYATGDLLPDVSAIINQYRRKVV